MPRIRIELSDKDRVRLDALALPGERIGKTAARVIGNGIDVTEIYLRSGARLVERIFLEGKAGDPQPIGLRTAGEAPVRQRHQSHKWGHMAEQGKCMADGCEVEGFSVMECQECHLCFCVEHRVTRPDMKE